MDRMSAWTAAALLGCVGCTVPHAQERPAVIIDPTPASRAELAGAVSEALHGTPVTLADDALTARSFLTLERTGPRDLEQRPLAGRVLEPPERFELVLSGGRCVLVHLGSGTRRTLEETTCRPE